MSTKQLTRAQRNLLSLHSLRWMREGKDRDLGRHEWRASGSAGDWCVWKPCPNTWSKLHNGRATRCPKLCSNCFGTGQFRLFHVSAEMSMEVLIELCNEYG